MTDLKFQIDNPPTVPDAEYGSTWYGQEGEDALLARLFPNHKTVPGFYVDVGAHHPRRFSNTFYFYQAGWRGINIDPTPGLREQFEKIRPRDIVVDTGIFKEPGILTYHAFREPALNTFDQKLADYYQSHGHPIAQSVQFWVTTLADVLHRYLPPRQAIDFLSIDVEGLEIEVLQSNDWDRYRPRIVLLEELNLRDLQQVAVAPTIQFLRSKGYEPIAKTFNTIFCALRDPEP